MTNKSEGLTSIAVLRNVSSMLELVYHVQDRDYGLPGMGMFTGWAGFGKSQAATFATIKTNAILIEANKFMRPKSLCVKICGELGIKPKGNLNDLIDQIAQWFSETGRPLIIDEADHLLQHDMLELVRVIHQGSDAAIILVGEELFPQNVKAFERVDSRMLARVQAQPGDMNDLMALARIYCPGIELSAEFRQYILKTCRYSHRRITTALSNIKAFARTQGVKAVDGAVWGNRTFDNGDAPAPRRAVA
jgi:DNA transposition AAA+ family ATPase